MADLAATVEAVEGVGNVLMVRLYEGKGAAAVGMGGAPLPPGAGPDAQQRRLRTLLAGLVDVQLIMEVRGEWVAWRVGGLVGGWVAWLGG